MQTKPNLISLYGLNIQGDLGGMTAYRSARQRFTWFAATTPKIAASIPQAAQRLKWAQAAALWSAMSEQDKNQWRDATRKARLCITAYNLWIHALTTPAADLLATIARKTGITLSTRTQNEPTP